MSTLRKNIFLFSLEIFDTYGDYLYNVFLKYIEINDIDIIFNKIEDSESEEDAQLLIELWNKFTIKKQD